MAASMLNITYKMVNYEEIVYGHRAYSSASTHLKIWEYIEHVICSRNLKLPNMNLICFMCSHDHRIIINTELSKGETKVHTRNYYESGAGNYIKVVDACCEYSSRQFVFLFVDIN